MTASEVWVPEELVAAVVVWVREQLAAGCWIPCAWAAENYPIPPRSRVRRDDVRRAIIRAIETDELQRFAGWRLTSRVVSDRCGWSPVAGQCTSPDAEAPWYDPIFEPSSAARCEPTAP